MKIYIERSGKKIQRKFSGKVSQMLKILGINPENVLVAKNNSLTTGDDVLKDSDEIKILSVISGG